MVPGARPRAQQASRGLRRVERRAATDAQDDVDAAVSAPGEQVVDERGRRFAGHRLVVDGDPGLLELAPEFGPAMAVDERRPAGDDEDVPAQPPDRRCYTLERSSTESDPRDT